MLVLVTALAVGVQAMALQQARSVQQLAAAQAEALELRSLRIMLEPVLGMAAVAPDDARALTGVNLRGDVFEVSWEGAIFEVTAIDQNAVPDLLKSPEELIALVLPGYEACDLKGIYSVRQALACSPDETRSSRLATLRSTDGKLVFSNVPEAVAERLSQATGATRHYLSQSDASIVSLFVQ